MIRWIGRAAAACWEPLLYISAGLFVLALLWMAWLVLEDYFE
jgi:hypothetical protein